MKKLCCTAAALLLLLLAACGTPEKPTQAEKPVQAGRSDMWRVELLEAKLADSLTAVLSAVQYVGGVLTTENEINPGEGNTFLLMQMAVEKIGTGKAAFSWADAHIVDGGGNAYPRHPNDTFLANLGVPRLKSADIVLGKESGWVCFEIPKEAQGLRFVADEGQIILEVNP